MWCAHPVEIQNIITPQLSPKKRGQGLSEGFLGGVGHSSARLLSRSPPESYARSVRRPVTPRDTMRGEILALACLLSAPWSHAQVIDSASDPAYGNYQFCGVEGSTCACDGMARWGYVQGDGNVTDDTAWVRIRGAWCLNSTGHVFGISALGFKGMCTGCVCARGFVF
jgi:hypothetical protein